MRRSSPPDPSPDEAMQVSEDLWVLPCGAYIESKKKPTKCPLCEKGDTRHFNALIPDLDSND
jgi:rubrerythrin